MRKLLKAALDCLTPQNVCVTILCVGAFVVLALPALALIGAAVTLFLVFQGLFLDERTKHDARVTIGYR